MDIGEIKAIFGTFIAEIARYDLGTVLLASVKGGGVKIKEMSTFPQILVEGGSTVGQHIAPFSSRGITP